MRPIISDRFDPRVEAERAIVASALRDGLSGSCATVGRYEAALAGTFRAAHAIAVSSGFGALVVALSALGLRPGDKVLLTPTCPLCTVYALTFMRLVPVFCDIRPDDFSMDLVHAEARRDGDTKALVDIPMWGYPVPADEVAAYARGHGLAFVLDLALAHMAMLDGRLLWTYADVATFSTHASKNFVTGEGGAVLTNDGRLAARARAFVGLDESFPEPGLNYGIGGLQAALGLARIERLAADISRRRTTMAFIAAGLDNPHIEPLPICQSGIASGTKLLLRDRSGTNRALIRHLADAGIPSDIATYDCRPLYRYPVFARHATACPNAERMLASITTIPVHPDLRRDDLDQIVSALNAYRPG